MDAADIAAFDQWLIRDPAHLNQVIPEQRAVVVCVPRWVSKQTDEPWLSVQKQKEDRQSYWLIRNGQRVLSVLD